MTKRRLIELRAELDLGQKELAEAANIGQSAISRWEAGNPVRETTALKVLRVINEQCRRRGLPELTLDDIVWVRAMV